MLYDSCQEAEIMVCFSNLANYGQTSKSPLNQSSAQSAQACDPQSTRLSLVVLALLMLDTVGKLV